MTIVPAGPLPGSDTRPEDGTVHPLHAWLPRGRVLVRVLVSSVRLTMGDWGLRTMLATPTFGPVAACRRLALLGPDGAWESQYDGIPLVLNESFCFFYNHFRYLYMTRCWFIKGR